MTKLAYQMSNVEIHIELDEIGNRLAGMDLGYGDRWNGEKQQIEARKELLEKVLTYRWRIGSVGR